MIEEVENIDYVVCQICGNKYKIISSTHLLKHNITHSEYKSKYPNAHTIADKTSKIFSDKTKISWNDSIIRDRTITAITIAHRLDTSREASSMVMTKRYEDQRERDNQSIRIKKVHEEHPDFWKTKAVRDGHEKIKIAMKNHVDNDPEFGKKISIRIQGVTYNEWEGFASDRSYCPRFDEKCRESNREKYSRKCFLTGLPERENITKNGKQRKLSVHHYDMDKMQGCNGKRWKLVPICLEWHNKVHTELWEARITWLLENVWN